MQKRKSVIKIICCCLLLCAVVIGTTNSGLAADAVNVILKNSSSSAIEVELIDQYGGNVSVTIDAGTSQNHTVKMNSKVTVKDGAVRVVTGDDEGKEVNIAEE
ncbi:MAG: hypothetical protein D3924_09845 [Candidatus Electrothrix sp. AR4]|nr:hypothetical protein [Candidatus Electrothrix sp. AR4]